MTDSARLSAAREMRNVCLGKRLSDVQHRVCTRIGLVLDEVVTSVDPHEREQFAAMIADWAAHPNHFYALSYRFQFLLLRRVVDAFGWKWCGYFTPRNGIPENEDDNMELDMEGFSHVEMNCRYGFDCGHMNDYPFERTGEYRNYEYVVKCLQKMTDCYLTHRPDEEKPWASVEEEEQARVELVEKFRKAWDPHFLTEQKLVQTQRLLLGHV